MGPHHGASVRQSFTRQAAGFEDDLLNGRLVTDGEWIFQRLELTPAQLVLDIAAGTGHAARGLAPYVGSVVALDATSAMLEAGHQAALASGLRNIVFTHGDASALPFLDDTFDVVVCRFAVHHFEEPDEQFAEMLRCLRPGGQLLVADLISSDEPLVAASHNALELVRDASHTRCLSASELRQRLDSLGAVGTQVDLHRTTRLLGPWLDQTGVSAEVSETIICALQDDIGGGRSTGLNPHFRGDELWFEQHFAAVTARAPG